MIDFSSRAAAEAAYRGHYDGPRFFGGILAMPVAAFVEKVKTTRDKPRMLKSAPVLIMR